MHNEIWKDIKGYEGLYQVSNFGKVKSLARYGYRGKGRGNKFFIKGGLKKLRIRNTYLCVNLSRDSIAKTCNVHFLVLESFTKQPKNFNYINHLDENPLNNYLNNLEWVNQRENTSFSIDKSKTSSKFVGVHFNKGNKLNPWMSQITIKGKKVYLGFFNKEIDAGKAYLEALQKYNLTNRYA